LTSRSPGNCIKESQRRHHHPASIAAARLRRLPANASRQGTFKSRPDNSDASSTDDGRVIRREQANSIGHAGIVSLDEQGLLLRKLHVGFPVKRRLFSPTRLLLVVDLHQLQWHFGDAYTKRSFDLDCRKDGTLGSTRPLSGLNTNDFLVTDHTSYSYQNLRVRRVRR
jgi:hypothetical protein